MDREKALNRIKKCLALSKSPNEHEAAAAMRQAQKLMEAHGICEEDVDEMAVTSDFVDHDDYEYSDRKPLILTSIARLMRKAFAVESVWERSPTGKHRVRYFGQQANVLLATHVHTVVYRAAGSAWRKYLKDSPWVKGRRNARASFVMGWCTSVADKVTAISPEPVVKERIERKKIEVYGAGGLSSVTSGTRSIYGDISSSGSEAGKSFSINRPVGSNRRYLENKS